LQVRAYGGAVADITGTYELGPADGQVLVRTGREGLAARAGHDLTIEITRWSARATVPDAASGGIAAATLTAELDLSSLAVRQGTGGAKPLTDRDRRDIQNSARKILGLQVTTPGPGNFRGSATVRQTDFGITPYSGFLGALKLRNEVAVEFDIRLKEVQNGSG
jgi:hypothetical protein